jgi:hypothetical protein
VPKRELIRVYLVMIKKNKVINIFSFKSNFAIIEDDKALIVGIGDVRKALKKNLVEIKVYDEHSSVGAYKGSTKG